MPYFATKDIISEVHSFPLSFSNNLHRLNWLIVDEVASDDNRVLEGSGEVA